jgi:hypothetical protein
MGTAAARGVIAQRGDEAMKTTMKIRTHVRAGATFNHNQTRAPRVRTGVKAGATYNHNLSRPA